jgi:CO/xanthine dehydrogenase FAD-binding subunit
MTLWKEYFRPVSVSEALQVLTTTTLSTCIIAGGTDLLLDIRQGRHSSVHRMVDVNHIPELGKLEIRQNKLFIGAAVVLRRIANSPLVIAHAQALSEACSLIGGAQIRNVATLGGNVAHALPAADGTIALVSLDAHVLVVSQEGRKEVPILEMFEGAGKSTLNTGRELIEGFIIPLGDKHCGSAFRRIMRSQGIALPIINISTWLCREKQRIEDLRIAIGPAGETPRRMLSIEKTLRRGKMDKNLFSEAVLGFLEEIQFRTSPHRATSDYRHQLVKILLKDTLFAAWERAG